MTIAQRICASARTLPEPLAQEVLDFIAFIKMRRVDPETDDLVQAQAGSMSPAWDNTDDDAWNHAQSV